MGKFGKIIAGTVAGILVIGSAGTGLAYKFSPTFKDKVDNVFHIGDKKEDLKKQIEELKQQLEAFKDAENTIKNLQAEKDQLQKEKDELQKQFDENQKQIAILKQEKSQLSEEMQAEIDELNTRISSLEKEQSNLQNRIDSLEKRVSDLEIQVADLQNQVADKQTQIDQLSTKITDLWSVFENYTLYTDAEENGEEPPVTEIKQSDKEALEERINQLETKVAELENTKADKTAEKQTKQEIINKYNNQKITINQTITNNNSTINNYNDKITNNNSAISDYSKTIDSNNTTISNNNNTIKELEQKESLTESEQTQLDNLKSENDQLQKENETKQSEIEKLQAEINTAKSQVAELEQVNQEQQMQVTDLEKRVAELESEVKVIESELSNLDKSIASVNSQISKFENFIKNSTIIDDSGTTDPNEPTNPDTPSTPTESVEAGDRYFDFNIEMSDSNYDEFFKDYDCDFQSTKEVENINSLLNGTIPSAYYLAQGMVDLSSEEITFRRYFGVVMFDVSDRENALNYYFNAIKDNESTTYYYYLSNNILYFEYFEEKQKPNVCNHLEIKEVQENYEETEFYISYDLVRYCSGCGEELSRETIMTLIDDVTVSIFTIENKEYSFIVGEYFKDWINSENNTLNLLEVNGQVENFEKTMVLTLNGAVVKVEDAIVENGIYEFKNKTIEEETETTYVGGASKSNPDLGALATKESAYEYLKEATTENGATMYSNVQSATSGYNLQNVTDSLVLAETDWGGYISIVHYQKENMQNVLNYILEEMEGKDNCQIVFYYITETFAVVESFKN